MTRMELIRMGDIPPPSHMPSSGGIVLYPTPKNCMHPTSYTPPHIFQPLKSAGQRLEWPRLAGLEAVLCLCSAVYCAQGSGLMGRRGAARCWLAGLLALMVNIESLAELVSIGTLFVFFCVCAGCLRRRYYEQGRSAPGPLITRLGATTLCTLGTSAPLSNIVSIQRMPRHYSKDASSVFKGCLIIT